jgi:hypothetical protein
MEYRWEPNSKYARAALADRYFPDFSDVKGVKGTVISTQGDVDHWEIKALFSEPNSVPTIADLLNTRIAALKPHTKGAVTLTPVGSNKSASRWNFTDDEGHDWIGEEQIAPALDRQGQLVVTLKLARQPDNRST